jgi:hypothetical protein
MTAQTITITVIASDSFSIPWYETQPPTVWLKVGTGQEVGQWRQESRP